MSLSERLGSAQTPSENVIDSDDRTSVDTKDAIKRNVHYLLIEEMGAEIDAGGDDSVLRLRIERKLLELLGHETAPLSAEDKREIVKDVTDNILGYGPIEEEQERPPPQPIEGEGRDPRGYDQKGGHH